MSERRTSGAQSSGSSSGHASLHSRQNASVSASACSGSIALGNLLVRREPREDERDALALVDRELRDRAHVLAARLRGRAEAERVRAGERDARVLLVLALAHPRDDAAVVEADRQLRAEVDAALDALDDADDVGRLAARRHEVEDARDRAVLRLPARLEDERVVEVAARARRRGATARASQRPLSGPPSSAAKQAPESKRGKQSQSIEPSRSTSAAVCRSPRSA